MSPDGASDVGEGVDVGALALAVNDAVAFVALFADSLLDIELLAGALDLAADAILVEVVSFGALDAGVATPDSAAEVVIKLHEKGRVAELSLGELNLLS